jgi:hypothetical protein
MLTWQYANRCPTSRSPPDLVAGRLQHLGSLLQPIGRDDGDRSGDDVDDLAGVLVDQFEFAAVVPQVIQAENAFGVIDGRVETRERVHAAAGRGDPGGEAVLGWTQGFGNCP